jgi:glycosyltransferase involved in cell wall biosynthesis
MKKVLFLYSHGGKIVTGGQKYEDLLFRDIQENPNFTIERRWLNNFTNRWNKYLAVLKNIGLLRKLKQYDLVLFNSANCFYFIPLIWLMRLCGRKVGVIHHHFMYMEKTGLRRPYYYLQEMFFLRAASVLLLPSPYMDYLCRKLFPKKPIYYWQIPFEPKQPALKMNPQPGNLLYIGTIEPRKGLTYLLDAMVLLKRRGVECSLKIVGKTVRQWYRDALDQTIEREQLKVEFTGFLTNEGLDRVTSEADIFAFPSQLEGYGMVICESMVNGTPVVCFNNSAMPYTVKDGVNGALVENQNVVAFADAIERITRDRTYRQELSDGALQTASGFMTNSRFFTTVNRDMTQILSE